MDFSQNFAKAVRGSSLKIFSFNLFPQDGQNSASSVINSSQLPH
jgi:hypothetical protein